MSKDLKFPFINKYKSPETLGSDRLALVTAATQIFPNKNVLVIDAGSCITYDLINDNREYMGGAISPGLQMRFKSLNMLTGKLPLVELDKKVSTIGYDTISCINTGVYKGTIYEIEGFISKYKEIFKELIIITTGGDSYNLFRKIQCFTFAPPLLLQKGLNFVLNNNIENTQ
ncbi:pantothenate kinase type III [Ichthyobacterium seriolicida]|uniref:Type III pantothenate kinase n=2 Tax=Ichthyobacterium seriolicida TaxID=242600 RepID=A0A1J1DZK6_9FLAO|nr:pantothenate kinase type III [Ichthyobacterium seriolicida]